MEEEQDIDDVLIEINERLESIERKLDMLSSQGISSQGQRRERESFSRDRNDSFSPRRELTKVQCAKCGAPCEVPFRPSGDRPVYCNACFGRQKDRSPSRGGFNKRGPSGFRPKKNRY